MFETHDIHEALSLCVGTRPPWDLVVEGLEVRREEARDRARRQLRFRRSGGRRRLQCRCGSALTQRRMGRPRLHCSRACREAHWRELKGSAGR